MALQLISPPAIEPVSLSDIKDFLRVDSGDTSQDGVILGLMTAARSWCETFTSRRFVSQTFRLSMDYFPGYIDMKLNGSKISSPFISGSNAVLVGIRYAIVLPYPMVQSITTFSYLNANGTTTTLNPSTDYVADLAGNPARLMPPFGQMWPVARVVANAVTVDFVTGYCGPVTVTMGAGVKVITGATFTPSQVGQPISIPGAGVSGASLDTILAAVDISGNGTTRDATVTAVNGVTAILNQPNAPAEIASAVRTAIGFLVAHWSEGRVPSDVDIPMQVKAILWPYRDLRF